MKAKRVEILSRLEPGEKLKGSALVCDDCDGGAFFILDVKGAIHFQCAACWTSYCAHEGVCEMPKRDKGN